MGGSLYPGDPLFFGALQPILEIDPVGRGGIRSVPALLGGAVCSNAAAPGGDGKEVNGPVYRRYGDRTVAAGADDILWIGLLPAVGISGQPAGSEAAKPGFFVPIRRGTIPDPKPDSLDHENDGDDGQHECRQEKSVDGWIHSHGLDTRLKRRFEFWFRGGGRKAAGERPMLPLFHSKDCAANGPCKN